MLGDDVSPGRPAPGPLAAARPRLAVRRRAGRRRVRQVLRGRRAAPEDRRHDQRSARTGAKVGHDLPRVGTGASKKAKRKALIPDPRNDENLIVAQTHLAMIHFHNRVVDRQPTPRPRGPAVQPGPQEGHPALPVADPARLPAADLQPGRARRRVHQRPEARRARRRPRRDVPTMPVEFSVAAFRLGHSMVRPTYNWNRIFPDGGRHPRLHVRVLRAGRRPRRRDPAAQQLARRLAADVRLRGRRPPGARRARTATSTTRGGSTPG